jgi:hypothetical protein
MRGIKVQLHLFITSTLDGRATNIHLIGGWVGLRGGLDVLEDT